MALKQNDFIEITYTGKITENGEVFDTSDETIAKEHHIHRNGAEYGPITICLGQGQLLKGLEEQLIGKDIGTHHFTLGADKAFGKKEPKLITMIPTKKFNEQNIKPIPNLRINIDGMIGLVKSVGGGRTIVDFNHPLAGKDVEYDVTVTRIVSDTKEQITALLKTFLGMNEPKINVEKDKTTIELPEKFPDQLKDLLKEKLTTLTSAKNIEFEEAKPLNTAPKKKE